HHAGPARVRHAQAGHQQGDHVPVHRRGLRNGKLGGSKYVARVAFRPDTRDYSPYYYGRNVSVQERKLPEQDNELVLMWEVCGRNYAETARQYDANESSVRKRIQ